MPDPAQNLQAYLVGGAVRDKLMGLKIKDRDWVVLGSTPEQMIELGFKPVGKNFPVFLHPHSGEEYALARTEKKVSHGYHGFEFNSSPDVTLEQDLARRDLTINAIAENPDGGLIDPFGGQSDVERKLLRHVSDSFREDPVRILRVSRFAARFDDSGFEIDPSTLGLMIDMVECGEVDALVPERVWQEMSACMEAGRFSRFVLELRNCAALKVIFPELDALFGIPQVAKYHPEIDTGVHTLMSLDAVEKLSDDPMVKFAVLVHDLGKALTPTDELPRHRGHERRGLKPIKALCDRLGVPARYREFALKVCEYHLHCHMVTQLKPATVLKVLEVFDGFRQPERIEAFSIACLADKRGRTGHEDDDNEAMRVLDKYHQAALAVNGAEIARTVADGDGDKIKKKLRAARVSAISRVKTEFQKPSVSQ